MLYLSPCPTASCREQRADLEWKPDCPYQEEREAKEKLEAEAKRKAKAGRKKTNKAAGEMSNWNHEIAWTVVTIASDRKKFTKPLQGVGGL
eukprot:1185840-Prorocentrum_minimum.AAC.2